MYYLYILYIIII